MKSSAVFLAAASGLLAACNPSPEDFGPQREDVIVERENSSPTNSPTNSVDYEIEVSNGWVNEPIIEFRPEGDPDTLCVIVRRIDKMECWTAPVNE